MIGKHLFAEVAPCADTPRFYGEFKKGVAKGYLNTMFEYVFNYNMKPTKVEVHLKKALVDNTCWVFVKRL